MYKNKGILYYHYVLAGFIALVIMFSRCTTIEGSNEKILITPEFLNEYARTNPSAGKQLVNASVGEQKTAFASESSDSSILSMNTAVLSYVRDSIAVQLKDTLTASVKAAFSSYILDSISSQLKNDITRSLQSTLASYIRDSIAVHIRDSISTYLKEYIFAQMKPQTQAQPAVKPKATPSVQTVDTGLLTDSGSVIVIDTSVTDTNPWVP